MAVDVGRAEEPGGHVPAILASPQTAGGLGQLTAFLLHRGVPHGEHVAVGTDAHGREMVPWAEDRAVRISRHCRRLCPPRRNQRSKAWSDRGRGWAAGLCFTSFWHGAATTGSGFSAGTSPIATRKPVQQFASSGRWPERLAERQSAHRAAGVRGGERAPAAGHAGVAVGPPHRVRLLAGRVRGRTSRGTTRPRCRACRAGPTRWPDSCRRARL